MNLDSKSYIYSSNKSNNLIMIFAGFILLSIAWFVGAESKEFYFSYLTSYFYWLSILLGGMFFTLVHYAFSSPSSAITHISLSNL